MNEDNFELLFLAAFIAGLIAALLRPPTEEE
jgi:hypothetical protein